MASLIGKDNTNYMRQGYWKKYLTRQDKRGKNETKAIQL